MQGRMGAEWLDETDCVGSWQNERLAAVIFPTADTLTKVRQLARVKGPHRLMLLINPQWQTDGQVVSDFGYVLGFSKFNEITLNFLYIRSDFARACTWCTWDMLLWGLRSQGVMLRISQTVSGRSSKAMVR
jgi:hypothetical protein